MIWVKTDGGRREMQTRSVLNDRQLRTLLLLVDGVKTDSMLLEHISGLTLQHFEALSQLGLIEPARATTAASAPASSAASHAVSTTADDSELNYSQFTATLTELISRELGLRGFTLTLAVEKAADGPELLSVAERAIAEIRKRKGDPAAEDARRQLFG